MSDENKDMDSKVLGEEETSFEAPEDFSPSAEGTGEQEDSKAVEEISKEEPPIPIQEEAPSVISQPDENGVRYYSFENQGKRTKAAIGSFSNPESKNRTLRNSLIIFGGIIVAIIVLGVSCNAVTSNFFSGINSISPSYSYDDAIYTPSDPYIGVLYVEGTIQSGNTDYFGTAVGYQHQWTLNAIDELMNDYNNRGMILFVDSPGGGVYESDELYYKIKEYQEATGNPVYAAMGSMAASGGYYISAPCDKIIANRNCWTGSIGVTIGTLYDASGLLDRFGINTVTISSGKNKSMGSAVEPLTAEQQAIFQSLVDEAYGQFVDVVAEGRGMDDQTVRRLADGRIYSAKQALDTGLVDGIGTLEDATYDMQEEYDLYDCEVVDIVSSAPSLLNSLFSQLAQLKGESGDVEALLKMMEDSNEFPVSYMCDALK